MPAKPQRKTAAIPGRYRELLIDRIEAAAAAVDLDPVRWATLCGLLLPEEYGETAAGEPEGAGPGSSDKIDAMAARRSAGRPLFHAGDATGSPREDSRP